MGLGDRWGKARGGLAREALPVDPAALGSGSFWPQSGLPRAILSPGIVSWHGFSCHLESHYWSFGAGLGGGQVLGLGKPFLLLQKFK